METAATSAQTLPRSFIFEFLPPTAVPLGRILARDVVGQVPDLRLLISGELLHHVPDRDEPGQTAVLQHRDVADALFGHDGHALVDRVVEPDTDHLGGHDRAHLGRLGCPPFEDDLAQIVPLGYDAPDFTGIDHEQGAGVVIDHALYGIVDTGPAFNGIDVRTLGSDQIGDSSHGDLLGFGETLPLGYRRGAPESTKRFQRKEPHVDPGRAHRDPRARGRYLL